MKLKRWKSLVLVEKVYHRDKRLQFEDCGNVRPDFD